MPNVQPKLYRPSLNDGTQRCLRQLSGSLIQPMQQALKKEEQWSQEVAKSLENNLVLPLSTLQRIAESEGHHFSRLSSLLIQKVDQLATGNLRVNFSSKRGQLTLELQEGTEVIFRREGVHRNQKCFEEMQELLNVLQAIEGQLEEAIKSYEKKYREEKSTRFVGFTSPPQVLKQVQEAKRKLEIFLQRSSHIDWAGESFYDSLLEILHQTGIPSFISCCFRAFSPKPKVPDTPDTPDKLLKPQSFFSVIHEQVYNTFQSMAENEGKDIGPTLIKGGLKSCMNLFISSEFMKKDKFFSLYADEKQRNLLILQMLKALEEDRFDQFNDNQLLIFTWFLFTEGQGLREALKSEGRAGLIYNLVYKTLDIYQSLYTRQWLLAQVEKLNQTEQSVFGHTVNLLTSLSGVSPVDFLDPIFHALKNYLALAAVGFFEEQDPNLRT